MTGIRWTSVKHGLTEDWVFGNLLIVSAEHRALGDDGTMGSQSLQVFLCFADITISLLLSCLLIVVCDAVAITAFVSGLLVSLAPSFEYCVHWSQPL